MRNQRLLIRPLVLVALALAVLLAVAVGLVYFTLDAPGRAQFARLLGPRAALLVLAWALGVVAAMAALQRWWVPRVSALPELAEQTRALVNASAPLQLKARAQADQQPLADAVNALAAQRDALRADVAAEVARASASVRLERNRLAALMSELAQAVVVCNREGRILLYNSRARLQFRALALGTTAVAGGALIGLGRSIFSILERSQIDHALDVGHQPVAQERAGDAVADLPQAQGEIEVATDAREGIPADGCVHVVRHRPLAGVAGGLRRDDRRGRHRGRGAGGLRPATSGEDRDKRQEKKCGHGCLGRGPPPVVLPRPRSVTSTVRVSSRR